MLKQSKKSKASPKFKPGTIHGGFRIANPPRSKAVRELLANDDFTTSGGARTVHHKIMPR